MLTKTIAELSTEFTTLAVQLVTAQSENAYLKQSVHCSANSGAPDDQGHRLANVAASSDQNPLRD